MAGLLVVLALLALVVGAFVAAFRQRVRANLERAGLELPAELAQRASAARPAARAAVTSSAAGASAALRHPGTTTAGLHFMLIYDVGPDFIQRRAQYREEHLRLAWQAAGNGELLLAGALEEPTEQAFLLFRGSRDAASRFAQADPYVRHGLVKQWRVKQWHTVVGESAAMPVRPGVHRL
jgi:hypothetical protein